ncbi:MAG: hypothetical protein B7Z51_08095 [Methyloversatilis sp. 12-65-5]|nr:MAG: hypothetical protein B7Z51_08095 [Methyloversatilis sp. 12-65-5]
MNPLFVLRRLLLLLCLLGAQHAALVHAYEHHVASGVQSGAQPALHPFAGSEHGSGLHAAACADCLASHALNAALPLTLPGLSHVGLGHVLSTAPSVQSAVCQPPEQRAHGPPVSSLI